MFDSVTVAHTTYTWGFHPLENTCIHGAYVGTPGGADHICGFCEAGMRTWVEDPTFQLYIGWKSDDGETAVFPSGITWRYSQLLSPYDWSRVTARLTEFHEKMPEGHVVAAEVHRMSDGYWTE